MDIKMKNYIVNGRVAREEIASDICDGTIGRSDIEKLISDINIKDAFIGSVFSKKKDKTNWNQAYLDTLPNVAIAEAFNEDYLLYLADVSEYVRNNKYNTRMGSNANKWIWIALGAVAVVILIVIVAMNTRQ